MRRSKERKNAMVAASALSSHSTRRLRGLVKNCFTLPSGSQRVMKGAMTFAMPKNRTAMNGAKSWLQNASLGLDMPQTSDR